VLCHSKPRAGPRRCTRCRRLIPLRYQRLRVGDELLSRGVEDLTTAPASREHELGAASRLVALRGNAERATIRLTERRVALLRRDVAAHEDRADDVRARVRGVGETLAIDGHALIGEHVA